MGESFRPTSSKNHLPQLLLGGSETLYLTSDKTCDIFIEKQKLTERTAFYRRDYEMIAYLA